MSDSQLGAVENKPCDSQNDVIRADSLSGTHFNCELIGHESFYNFIKRGVCFCLIDTLLELGAGYELPIQVDFQVDLKTSTQYNVFSTLRANEG